MDTPPRHECNKTKVSDNKKMTTAKSGTFRRAMVVGAAGMILRGGHASAGDYVNRKVLDWLGW